MGHRSCQTQYLLKYDHGRPMSRDVIRLSRHLKRRTAFIDSAWIVLHLVMHAAVYVAFV